MFGFGKNKLEKPAAVAPERPSLFNRLKERLVRTRANFTEGLARIFTGRRAVTEEILTELEERLLLADVGIDATTAILNNLRERIKNQGLNDTETLYHALHENLFNLLIPCSKKLIIPPNKQPFVILMVGVNGSGKTTTIGKLAFRFRQEGRSILLAAGDTFRAAAVEQLKVWGERNDISVIAQIKSADAASVIFDALQAAQARQLDLVIADTAGRLHNKAGLMDELKKIKRVLAKLDDSAPHEVLLVLDATTGQNALIQAEQFHQALGVTGIILTKLDGTAKGGILFAIAQRLRLPIRFIGVGEDLEDLREFDAKELVDALLSQ